MTFFAELRRRKVLRVAALYIVGSWLIIQVAGEAGDAWDIHERALRYVWVVAIAGFPIALIFGWRYDIVAGRIVRTLAADPDKPENLSLQRIDYAILAALIAVTGLAVFSVVQRLGVGPDIQINAPLVASKSIAVLPFDNLSGDSKALSFTAGIHDDILTQIAKISELRVISRTSVVRLDPTMSIREIGGLLDVATVLEGGVQRSGDQLRINVQLIDANTDAHLWAETFDRKLTTSNIFAIQTEIAQAVALALQAKLSSREQQNLAQIPTKSFAAYEAYLLGNQQMIPRTIQALQKARESFATAVALDPDFALAHVRLADSILLLNNYGAMSLDEAIALTDPLLDRALELDSELAAAYASVGLSLSRQLREAEAGVAYERAIELDPNYAPAFHWYGDILLNRGGNPDKSLSLLLRARELDPLSPVINVTLGQVYDALGRFEEARAQYEKVISIEPDYAGAYFGIAILERHAFGRIDAGIRWHIEELRRDSNRPGTGIVFAYLDLGDDESAERWVDWALERHPGWFFPLVARSQLHRYRGEADEAVRYAEQLETILPGNNTTMVTLIHFGHDQRVLELFRKNFPDYDCDTPPPDTNSVFVSINVSLAMERIGDADCAQQMLETTLHALPDFPRLGGRGYGIADTEIYARLGETELAIDSLREAVDAGWRTWWWAQGPGSPHNANIADDARFVAIMDEIRADLALQLENVRQMEANGELDLL